MCGSHLRAVSLVGETDEKTRRHKGKEQSMQARLGPTGQ